MVTFLQASKNSTFEVTDVVPVDEISLDLQNNSSEIDPEKEEINLGKSDKDIAEVAYPNLEFEFIIPFQVFPMSTNIKNAPISENLQIPELFLLENSATEEPKVSELDDDEVIAIIENSIGSDLVSHTHGLVENENERVLEGFNAEPEKERITNLEDNLEQTKIEEKQDLSSLSDEEIIRLIAALAVNNEEPSSQEAIMSKVSDAIISKRNAPNVLSVTVTSSEKNKEYVTERAIYAPQYSPRASRWDFQPYKAYTEEPSQVYSNEDPTPANYRRPLTVTVDQSRSYYDNFYKRNLPQRRNSFSHKTSSDDNFDINNYVEMLKIHDAYDINPPLSVYNVAPNQYNFHKGSPRHSEYPSENIHKRSTTCGCSSCSKKTDSSCSPEIIEKPTFIIEEAPETVEKPAFKVTEKSETITKPDFVVKEVTEVVSKPNFSVQEKVETVEKPNFVVEETSEKVKKPIFKIEEQSEVVVKPEFVIEETPEIIEKPEFTIEENVETVVKPKYKVETQTETVDKPNFVVKEHVLQVQKPEFVVTEKTEKVHKPEFKVEEKIEVVKKPRYQIQEQIVPVTKPNFIVEETEVVVEKPEYVVTEEILPVQKPHYLIKETQEVVEKPEFYVTEIIETVAKPNYLVEETQQTVTKPYYNVEDEHQTVKKPQFVVQEQPQVVVKPEFIVEETTIPVVKPEYIIEEVVENVQKPSYLVKPTPCYVEKPEFVVHEIVEKVSKPLFKVVEKKETVKKPSFVVEEEVQTVYKPCFNVVTCTGPPRRVSPKFVKGSHGRQYYSRRPSYHRRKSYRSQHQHHAKTKSHIHTSHNSDTSSTA